MARIHEEVLIFKLSRLVKEDAEVESLATDDIQAALEQVAQELVGDNVVIEVEKK